jgi:hypothetical protein
MPNAAVRASAKALPEDKPDDTSEKQFAKDPFDRAYAVWLRARAAIEDQEPNRREDEQFVSGLFDEEKAAARALFAIPALNSDTVWNKLEVFQVELIRELTVGLARDSVLMLGLGSIKSDLINLDF